MGIQQGTPPHLSTHHTTSILLGPENPSEPPCSVPSLPSINTDVSDFFIQLENPESGGLLSMNSFSGSDKLHHRFHPYEGRGAAGHGGFKNPAMTTASTPAVQSYISMYNATFNDGGVVYQTSYDYVSGGFGGGGGGELPAPTHDQSGEEIWDMDSNTVRRYNPGPDPVSPGPIPTTPTMYGQQQQSPGPIPTTPTMYGQPQQQPGLGKLGLYPQYGAIAPAPPPQPISPGIGGPWIGGALPVKGHTAVEAKKPKSYQCEACDKWFTSSGHLKRHFNTTLHKNAMKQKGDGFLDGLNGGTFSIPSVESRGAPSPCMSLGEESSQSSVCDELSSQSSQVSLPPAGTPGPGPSIIQLNPPTSRIDCSPTSNTSSNVPNVSPSQQMLSPPPSSVGGPDSASSPLSGLTQLVGVAPPSTPQPAHSPLTPASGVSLSPNGAHNGSPAHKNRFSPFRAGGGVQNSVSYKVQSIDHRSYPSYPATFQTLSAPPQQQQQLSAYSGDVYMSPQTSYRTETYSSYSGQYQYQPAYSTYDMGGQSAYLNHASYTDISGYGPLQGELHPFPENGRALKLEERDSPEGSEGSETSLKNENGEFRCNECNKMFNKMCYLKQHNKSFHNGEKPFKCTQCGKRFPVDVLYQVTSRLVLLVK